MFKLSGTLSDFCQIERVAIYAFPDISSDVGRESDSGNFCKGASAPEKHHRLGKVVTHQAEKKIGYDITVRTSFVRTDTWAGERPLMQCHLRFGCSQLTRFTSLLSSLSHPN